MDSRRRDGEDYTCNLLLDDHGTTSTSDDERGSLVDFYVKVASEHLSERGVLAVVNYPRIFAPSNEWPGWSSVACAGVKRGDADRLGRLADHLNGRIANAVKGANSRLGAEKVLLIDRAAAFRDGSHELCGNGQDWLNGISAFRGTDRIQHETSFHPNLGGHQGITQSVADQVEAALLTNTRRLVPGSLNPYAGVWRGPVDQPGARAYNIALTLEMNAAGVLSGTVDYPELGCGGTVTFVSLDNGVLSMREQITYGGGCVLSGMITLRLDSDTTATWTYGSSVQATAAVTKDP